MINWQKNMKYSWKYKKLNKSWWQYRKKIFSKKLILFDRNIRMKCFSVIAFKPIIEFDWKRGKFNLNFSFWGNFSLFCLGVLFRAIAFREYWWEEWICGLKIDKCAEDERFLKRTLVDFDYSKIFLVLSWNLNFYY